MISQWRIPSRTPSQLIREADSLPVRTLDGVANYRGPDGCGPPARRPFSARGQLVQARALSATSVCSKAAGALRVMCVSLTPEIPVRIGIHISDGLKGSDATDGPKPTNREWVAASGLHAAVIR